MDRSGKAEYLVTANIGTLVAFQDFSKKGFVKTKAAKVVKNEPQDSVLILETEYGKRYSVDYKNVLWVRTGNRWPRGVYELFKAGYVKVNDSQEGAEDGQARS